MTFVVVANLDDLEVGDTMLGDELREPVCLVEGEFPREGINVLAGSAYGACGGLHGGTVWLELRWKQP